jgi:hypothetical protein
MSIKLRDRRTSARITLSASSFALTLALFGCSSEMVEPRAPGEEARVETPAMKTQGSALTMPRQAVQPVGATTQKSPASTEPTRDPVVLQRLDEMGAFLREQKNFYVRADVTTDEILESGQKVQLMAKVDLWASRPNRLRAKMVSDRKEREIFYDGKSFTLWGPKAGAGYYATAEAPSTLSELMSVLSEKYYIEAPFVDLFYWGTPLGGLAAVERAQNIGPATIGKVQCDHFALHQSDVDWQIWIERGAKPLPRKLVITTLTEPEQPQHEVTYEWTLDKKMPEAFFTFNPPKGAHKIKFSERPGARGTETRKP